MLIDVRLHSTLHLQDEYMPLLVTSLVQTQSGDVITGDSDGGLAVWRRDENDTYVMTDDWSVGLRHAHKVRRTAVRMTYRLIG